MANIPTKIIANQKFGIAIPICVALMTVKSPAFPLFAAAYMPVGRAMTVDNKSAYNANGSETHKRSPTISVTFVLYV